MEWTSRFLEITETSRAEAPDMRNNQQLSLLEAEKS